MGDMVVVTDTSIHSRVILNIIMWVWGNRQRGVNIDRERDKSHARIFAFFLLDEIKK